MSASSQRRRCSRWRMFLLLLGVLGYIRQSAAAPTYPRKNTDARTLSSSDTSPTKRSEVGLPSELAWQAWLLVDPHSGAHSDLDSSSLLRRITPKSVFIAPVLPACPDGYQADTMGRCVKNVNIDHQAHLDFIVKRLNAMYANVAANSGSSAFPSNSQSQKQSTGPLQLNIPLAASSNSHPIRIEQEPSKIQREGDGTRQDEVNSMKIPMLLAQRSEERAGEETQPEKTKIGLPKVDGSESSVVRDNSTFPLRSVSKSGSPTNVVISIHGFEHGGSTNSSSSIRGLDERGDVDSMELPSESVERFSDKRKLEKILAMKNYNVYEIKNDTNLEEDEEEDENEEEDDDEQETDFSLKSTQNNKTVSSQEQTREQHIDSDIEIVDSIPKTDRPTTRMEPTVTPVTGFSEFDDESTTSFPESTVSDRERTEETTELLITVTTPRDVERKDLGDATISPYDLRNDADLEEVETTFSVVSTENDTSSAHVQRSPVSTRSTVSPDADYVEDETTTSLPESTRIDREQQTEETTEAPTTTLPRNTNYSHEKRERQQQETTTADYEIANDADFDEELEEDVVESVENDSEAYDLEPRRHDRRGALESKNNGGDSKSRLHFVGIPVLEIIEGANSTRFSGVPDYKVPTDVETY